MYCAHGADDKAGGAGKKANAGRGARAGAGDHLKGLSGGERSYATLAFVMALARVSESPLQILDEPDVFMDPVTRKLALDLMLAEQRRSGAQLVYATPHDVRQMVAESRKRAAPEEWQCSVNTLSKLPRRT